MAPYIPFSSAASDGMLKLECDHERVPWGEAVIKLQEGHKLTKPIILFKKLEADKLFEKRHD